VSMERDSSNLTQLGKSLSTGDLNCKQLRRYSGARHPAELLFLMKPLQVKPFQHKLGDVIRINTSIGGIVYSQNPIFRRSCAQNYISISRQY